MRNVIRSGTLSAESIDAMSDAIDHALKKLKMDPKDVLRIRLAAEDCMIVWASELGENTPCRLLEHRRFGKTFFSLQTDGKSVDPTQYRDDLFLSVSSNPNLTAALGLPMTYGYSGGRNELKFRAPDKPAGTLRMTLIAILAALVVGFGLRYLASGVGTVLTAHLVSPLMDAFTNLLRLISGPLVFLSILSGITGMGDASSLSKIGSTLTVRFLFRTFVIAALVWLSLLWMFPLTLSGGSVGGGGISQLINMVLDIIPSDIVSPFRDGNAMQIIFMAAGLGIGCILLGDVVPETLKVIGQFNAVVQLLMSKISRLLPAYIFLCIVDLVLTSEPAQLAELFLPLLMIVVLDLILPLLYDLITSLRTGLPFTRLLRFQFPSYLAALTTASSAAAFTANLDCCENKLHIDPRLVQFGVPLGQVLFMPGAAVEYGILSLYMARQYDVQLTPVWILTMLIIATILAAASPPIPGGGLSAIFILFSQLGISTEALAVCAAILTFSDYPTTACNIVCLQDELLLSAKKLGMLKKPKE